MLYVRPTFSSRRARKRSFCLFVACTERGRRPSIDNARSWSVWSFLFLLGLLSINHWYVPFPLPISVASSSFRKHFDPFNVAKSNTACCAGSPAIPPRIRPSSCYPATEETKAHVPANSTNSEQVPTGREHTMANTKPQNCVLFVRKAHQKVISAMEPPSNLMSGPTFPHTGRRLWLLTLSPWPPI